MRSLLKITIFVLLLVGLPLCAQTKKNTRTIKPTPTPAATPVPTAEPTAEPIVKKNGRPADAAANTNLRASKSTYQPVYVYEFDRPGFTFPQIRIEHDETGVGKIFFKKDGDDEWLDDPISLSAETMATLRTSFDALDFLNSAEEYQTKMDHSNMGNVTITIRRDGHRRSAKYNWTDNKDAKMLMDEYRRISNEYTWRFDILGARENQPLLTPGMMDALDSYIQRGEISDPPHIVPFLTELSNDERLPLMARNHAAKLIKQIEKAKK